MFTPDLHVDDFIMRTVLGHSEKYHVDFAIKLGDYNVGKKDKLLTLPMYMAFLLNG